MNKSDLELAIKQAEELTQSPTCCNDAKAAARRWLDAVGTPRQRAEAESLIAELEEDIEPIDGLIEFAESERAAGYFGAEKAAEVAKHAREIKAAGALYCDCHACALAAKILENKAALLG